MYGVLVWRLPKKSGAHHRSDNCCWTDFLLDPLDDGCAIIPFLSCCDVGAGSPHCQHRCNRCEFTLCFLGFAIFGAMPVWCCDCVYRKAFKVLSTKPLSEESSSNPVRTFLAFTIFSIVFYPLGWLISYVFFMGIDFRYFFTYWTIAWSGGGELSTFIQIGAICSAIFLAVVAIVLKYIYR
jgi:hypothetical protein